MDALPFLPTWPPTVAPLAWIAVLLLAAIVAGEAVRRWLRVSRVIGHLAVGALLGPAALGVVDAPTLAQLRIFADIAVGLLLFELGQRAELGWLRRNPMLLAVSAAEAALTFVAVFAVMSLFGLRPVTAAAAGVLAMATAPAVVMTVIKDARAQGQVTERITLLTVLNTAYAVVALTLLFGWLSADTDQPPAWAVLQPIYLLLGSSVMALVLARLTLYLLGLFGRRPAYQFAITVGVVLLTVTLAGTLNLSVPLALLLLGVFSRTLDPERHFVSLRFGESAMLFVVLLFALAGASLQFAGWQTALPIALAFIGTRFVAKLLPVVMLAAPTHTTTQKAWLVALGLTPMSGLALLMLADLTRHAPRLSGELGGSMFLAITLLAFLGPLATEFALKRAGETSEEPR